MTRPSKWISADYYSTECWISDLSYTTLLEIHEEFFRRDKLGLGLWCVYTDVKLCTIQSFVSLCNANSVSVERFFVDVQEGYHSCIRSTIKLFTFSVKNMLMIKNKGFWEYEIRSGHSVESSQQFSNIFRWPSSSISVIIRYFYINVIFFSNLLFTFLYRTSFCIVYDLNLFSYYSYIYGICFE